MNWDERLKDARERRAKIMEAKRPETVEGKKPFIPTPKATRPGGLKTDGPGTPKRSGFSGLRNDAPRTPKSDEISGPQRDGIKPPKNDDDDKLDKLRLAVSGQAPREASLEPVVEKSRRGGVVLVVFGVGILLGVGLMQLQGGLGSGASTSGEQAEAETPEPIVSPLEPTPAPVEQTALPAEPTRAPIEQATIPADPTPAPVEDVATSVEPTPAPVEPVPEPVEQAALPAEQAPAPLSQAEAPSDPAPAPIETVQTPVEPTPEPAEPAPVVAEVLVPPLIFDQVRELVRPAPGNASSGIAFPGTVATFTQPQSTQLAAATTADAVPSVGTPPAAFEPDVTPSQQAPDAEVPDTLASLDTNVTESAPASEADAAPTPESVTPPIEAPVEASPSDAAPDVPETAAVPELDPATAEAPVQIVTDGVVRPIWIFAPGSVTNDVLETTQTTAESLNLSLQAVNRVTFRISRNQVRYYDQDSAEAAEQLAAQIGAVARDFTTSGIDAQPGTLEVYLAGRSSGTRATSTASSQRSAPSNDANSLRSSVIGRIRAGLGN